MFRPKNIKNGHFYLLSLIEAVQCLLYASIPCMCRFPKRTLQGLLAMPPLHESYTDSEIMRNIESRPNRNRHFHPF